MLTTDTVRFSQFNASLNRNTEGQLFTDLSTPNNAQAKSVAEIIQRNNPDVLLINEFDYVSANPLQVVQLLQQNYLGVSQNGAAPVNYPYVYIAPSNTGISSGFDLNNNGTAVTTLGTAGYGDDSFGFGNFPGQFGMLLLSKYPIDTANVRTFQNFLWKDMPGNLLTSDPTVDNPATAVNENLNGFYSAEEINALRLSSKSHWDVPIVVNGVTVHVLVSHPTPPTFDGTEDRNGKRNHDEIRFWSDYITPGQGSYIYDDKGGKGGIDIGSNFVIMGDQNADPSDGDSFDNAIRQLLQNPNVNTNATPSSVGAVQQSTLQGGANLNHKGNPSFDTSDFSDTAPGNLRTDYVLPSANLNIARSAVFWSENTDPNFPLVGTFNASLPGGFPSSDHRLVYADVQLGTATGKTVSDVNFLGQTIFATGFIPTGVAESVNGAHTAVGGLSGVTYDSVNNRYFAISDDRSQFAPARFYTFTTDPNSISTTGVTFTNVTPLKDPSGNFFAALSVDPEGIALTQNGTVYISSEGEANPAAGRVTNPFIKEFDLATGQELRSLSVPKKFLPVVQDTNSNGVVDTGDTQTAGIRNNLAFESLTITPNQKTLYTATENALFQDGGVANPTTGTRSRILQYNLATGQPEKEYLYVTDPVAVPPNPAGQFSTNGLVDLLAIDDRGTLLALERSFSTGAPGTGNTIKIYEISLQGATDIGSIDALNSLTPEKLAAIAPVQKRLLLNLDDLALPTGLDNVEGLTFGPKLADGRQSIVLVSDNNFSATQFTQILTLGADLIPTAIPTVETRPALLDDPAKPFSERADADDPAIYVNPTDSSKSLVLTSVKNGGLRVYDLTGNLVQTINPPNAANPSTVRYNNIDLQYGFTVGGQKLDIAVASDRNNDKLAIFKINPNATSDNILEDVTDTSATTLFQGAPFVAPYSASSRSAYGLALYRSPITNDYYAFVSRRQTGDVAQLKLIDKGNGKIGYEQVRSFTIPSPTASGRSAQTEGMVVDQETGFLYIAQEEVGIWKFQAEPTGSNTGKLIDKVQFEGGTNLVDDAEGLTIYYGKNGTGYLLASSQGDNTFAVYTREGNNDYIGQFAVGNNGSIDSVQESDGADVINLPLGSNFPSGLFVTQDGNNDPATVIDDENISSNFKLVPFENIANAFPTPLKIDTSSYDPRNPVAQPKLTTYDFTNLPKLGTTSKGQDILLGGFSGLAFQGLAPNGNLKFVTHTDRGPNGEPTGQNRPFFLPNFQPEIVSFELNRTTGEIAITKRTGLFGKDGTTPLTGLPNLQAKTNGLAYTDEIGVDLDGKVLANDPLGADVEGIAVAPNGDYWMVDEYRPAIYHFDINGKLLDRFIPKGTATAPNPDSAPGTFGTEVLPEVYAQRRSNRGFEAVALDGDKLYAFIQSAIDNPDNAGDTASRGSRNLRILEFDIVSKTVTGEYLYLLDNITGTGNARTDKIGDAVALGNGKFAVVERDDLATSASNKLIYQIDLAGATNINNTANFTLPAGKTIEQLTPAELSTAKIAPVNKSLIANAAQLGYTGVEKLEGLALVAPNTLALINDNDFNVSGNSPTERLGILELPKNLEVTPTTVDLELSQTVDNAAPQVGDTVVLSLTITNKGPATATGIQVKDLLPQELALVNIDQNTYSSQTGIWAVGTLTANSSITLKVTAKVTGAGALKNTAEIVAANQFDIDSTPNNGKVGEDDLATVAIAAAPGVTLKGFASLPADTFADGPAAGSAVANPTNGRTTPFPDQPIQGFSAVQVADANSFYFMPDNGFGAKGNSADFLLRVYKADPSFRGAELNGDGSVKVQSFIQLSDPDKKVPFKIVNEGTGDRLLTGADFDIESFNIAADGTLWFGEEFEPYVLHTDATGKVLEAPIPTPNPFKLNTLDGKAPIVIGHRGASGELPEHTLGAYKRAIEQGADFIEPDLVSTKDGVLIARHEPNLINTTDVASRPEFASRKTTKIVDGIAEEGFFASDFTLAEIKTIRAIMPQGFRTQVFNGLYEIPTLEEIIALVKQTEADTGRKIGIYPETKHPTFHDDLGLSLEEPLLATLQKTGFTDPDRIFIQSFEVSNLKELNQKTDLPLVQLLDAFDVGLDGSLIYESVNKQPYDFTVKGDPRTYADLQTPDGLKEISTYADGIGPWKRMIVSVKGVDANGDGQADDVNGDGAVNDADKTTTAPTSLVKDAHAADLLVHPYTFRNEGRSLASNYNGDPAQEFQQFINLGVDGYFTDFPATGDLVRDQITAPFVRSPQNPDVLKKTTFNTLDGNAPLVIGHRGASGSRPEHTLEAYKLAIADGADFIEPDLVATKDGILVARHENALAVLNADGSVNRTDTGTDIATRPEFADRKTTKVIDGRTITGWFTEDLTLAEIKTLNAIERLPDLRGTRFDGDKLKVPTLTEIIDLVKQVEKDTGRKIGIYPETKHPTFFATEGTRLDGTKINTNLGKLLVDTLVANSFTDPKRIFIQSFEVGNLQELNSVIMPAAGIDIPLIQLYGGATDKPYDFRVSGDPRTYGDLTKPAELANIAKYAAGIGPNKRLIVPASTVDLNNDSRADDLNGDGQISDADRRLGTPTTLVQDAHTAGLQVHPYTFRNEGIFLAADYGGDPKKEFEQFIALGVDAYFTDFPGTGDLVRDQLVGQPAVANLGGSRGFEGMAISLDKKTLYPLLEGTVVGDPANALRVYEFDVDSSSFKVLLGYYRKENPANAIGDFTVINKTEYLVIERDNNQGAAAKFKKIFKVDLSQKDKDGYFAKEEVVDLLNVKDPNDLNQDGSSQFTFPFQTIESIVVLDANTLLVGNDNNYPFSIGRPPAIDNNEIIQLSLSKPLNLATPVLSVVAEPKTATEADSKAGIFRVTRVANTSTAQTFTYTLSGTATNGVDYANLTGTATIEAGQTSVEIKVIPVDDAMFEPSETVSLKLNDGTGYTVDLALANATVTIADNDVDRPTVSTVGTPGDDDLFAKPGSPFDGQNDIVFTGAGNDTVDLVLAASPTAGNNRINTGSGSDTIFANKNDRLFGSTGSDTFDATDGQGGNRMSGGAGDDVFFLGKGDRALGGDGNDKFYVQTGVNNLLSGGAGNDQFWIVNAEISSAANTVLDFQIGTDVIGFSGTASLGISATTLQLSQVGTDTAILFGSQTLATLSGIQAAELTLSNPNQFVFA